MAVELISKIKPKNNGSFSLVDAVDVCTETDENGEEVRLDVKLAELIEKYNALGEEINNLVVGTVGTATTEKAGVVKIGANLSITADGVLSADAQEIGIATTESDGLMSSADKQTLDGLTERLPSSWMLINAIIRSSDEVLSISLSHLFKTSKTNLPTWTAFKTCFIESINAYEKIPANGFSEAKITPDGSALVCIVSRIWHDRTNLYIDVLFPEDTSVGVKSYNIDDFGISEISGVSAYIYAVIGENFEMET